MDLVDRLKALSPSVFENAVFDLMAASGLRNLVWRTPGADQGRDIEGDEPTVDLSGSFVVRRWYVECKRYDQALDWPTVREKISYAENHGADYLLIATTAHLSPQCKTEVSKWNTKARAPIVRFWDSATIEGRFQRHSAVLSKFGLSEATTPTDSPYLALSAALSFTVQAAYGRDVMGGTENPELEVAAAFAELLLYLVSINGTQQKGASAAFDPEIDGYPWLSLGNADVDLLCRYGFRALVCGIRHVLGTDRLNNTSSCPAEITFARADDSAVGAAAHELLSLLALWADLELVISNADVTLNSRQR